jgi:ribulose bisphosphate carboxylase small subunit
MAKINSEQRTAKRPRGKPFQKGDPRINRQGKSKELAELERELRQAIIDELCRIDEFDPEHKRTNLEALVRRLVELGKGGNLAAIESLMERILGKPVQPHSGSEGTSPFRVIIERIGM